MPTYEYECRQCGRHFDKFQNMIDAPLKKCTECGGELKRLFGAGAGIICKGSVSSAKSACPAAAHCNPDQPCCGGQAPCHRH